MITQLCSLAQHESSSVSGKVTQPGLPPTLMFKMDTTIENPADCKVCTVVNFPWVKNCTAVNIHHERCVIYEKEHLVLLENEAICSRMKRLMSMTRCSRMEVVKHMLRQMN